MDAEWRDITKAPPGKTVLLWAPGWRHPFPGQYTGVDTRVVVDTCEPEAKGWHTFASDWTDLPDPPPQPPARARRAEGVGGESP